MSLISCATPLPQLSRPWHASEYGLLSVSCLFWICGDRCEQPPRVVSQSSHLVDQIEVAAGVVELVAEGLGDVAERL